MNKHYNYDIFFQFVIYNFIISQFLRSEVLALRGWILCSTGLSPTDVKARVQCFSGTQHPPLSLLSCWKNLFPYGCRSEDPFLPACQPGHSALKGLPLFLPHGSSIFKASIGNSPPC